MHNTIYQFLLLRTLSATPDSLSWIHNKSANTPQGEVEASCETGEVSEMKDWARVREIDKRGFHTILFYANRHAFSCTMFFVNYNILTAHINKHAVNNNIKDMVLMCIGDVA